MGLKEDYYNIDLLVEKLKKTTDEKEKEIIKKQIENLETDVAIENENRYFGEDYMTHY